MKLFFCDVETTGLNPEKNAIIQLAGAIEVDGKLEETFNYFMRPFENAVIEPDALQVHGWSAAQIMEFPHERDTYISLQNLLSRYVDKFNPRDKMFWIGYNAPFDVAFVRALWIRMKDKYFGSWFWHPALDLMTISAWCSPQLRKTAIDWRLTTAAVTHGVVTDGKEHDAQHDIELTRQLYHKLRLIRGM